MSPRRRAVLDAGAHFLLSAVAVIVAWRTAAEATSLYESGAASMMLSWQMWPATGSMVPSLVPLALAGLYNAFLLFRDSQGLSPIRRERRRRNERNFIGLLMFAALMGFLVYRVHIGIAMFIVGAGGYLAM